ncbi:hypothetical protein GCM10027456_78960 [Kineosporia babensis]
MPNQRLIQARRRLSSPSGSGQEMSPQELAEAINAYVWEHHKRQANLDRSYINKLENGTHRWPNPQYGEAFRHILGVPTDAALGFYGRRNRSAKPSGQAAHQETDATTPPANAPAHLLSERVRCSIVAGEPIDANAPKTDHLQLRALVTQMNGAYQGADYERALALVPAVMNAVAIRATSPSGDPRSASAAAALAHLALSKLMLKLGDIHLAWITADRARAHARAAEDPTLETATHFSIGCALYELPDRQDEARHLVERGLATARSGTINDPARISVVGALTLLAAVLASRRHDLPQAEQHLQAARVLADQLGGDRNELWTGFGPTNVLIHQVGITTETDPQRAIDLGERLDTSRMPVSLVSRRTQVHLDLATAFSQRPEGDPSALLHLLQAEVMAPQLLRVHPPARSLIMGLLTRERRTSTPGLRALAARAKVEV